MDKSKMIRKSLRMIFLESTEIWSNWSIVTNLSNDRLETLATDSLCEHSNLESNASRGGASRPSLP